MDMIKDIVVTSLYLLALINPVSKIAVLSGLPDMDVKKHMAGVVRKSSLTAACILIGAMFFGNFVLQKVFHIELHSAAWCCFGSDSTPCAKASSSSSTRKPNRWIWPSCRWPAR